MGALDILLGFRVQELTLAVLQDAKESVRQGNGWLRTLKGIQLMQKQTTSKQARLCYYVPADAYIEGRGFRASVVVEGEAGHYPTGVWPNDGTKEMPYFWGHDYNKALEVAARYNQQLGLSEKDVNTIVSSSIGAQLRKDRTRPKNWARFHVKKQGDGTWAILDRDLGDAFVDRRNTRQTARRIAWSMNREEELKKESQKLKDSGVGVSNS